MPNPGRKASRRTNGQTSPVADNSEAGDELESNKTLSVHLGACSPVVHIIMILLYNYQTTSHSTFHPMGTQNNITSKINLLVFYYVTIARSKMTIIIVFESTQNLEYSGLARVFWWCDNNRKNMFNSKQQQHKLKMVLSLIIVHDQRYHKTINRALDHIIRSVPFHSIIPPTPANCEYVTVCCLPAWLSI